MQQPSNKTYAMKKAVPRFSKSDHETLAEIFKKIGQKEQTKQVDNVNQRLGMIICAIVDR